MPLSVYYSNLPFPPVFDTNRPINPTDDGQDEEAQTDESERPGARRDDPSRAAECHGGDGTALAAGVGVSFHAAARRERRRLSRPAAQGCAEESAGVDERGAGD